MTIRPPLNGRNASAGNERRVAQRLLQVVGQEQEDPEHPGRADEEREVRAAPVAVEHHPGRQQRMRRPALPERERHSQRDACGQEPPGGRRVPAVRGRVGEAVDQAEHRAGDQQRAGDVEPGLNRGRLPLQQQRSAGERHRGEDQVHIQAPAPGQVLGQRAAEQQAHRAAGRGDRPVDGERLGAVLRRGERGGQQRQRGGHQQRRERALAGPRGDQHGEVDRGAADGRDHGEPGQAGQERDLAAEQVGQPAAEQQQAAERQRVGGDHPLPVHGGETAARAAPTAARCSSPSGRGPP